MAVQKPSGQSDNIDQQPVTREDLVSLALQILKECQIECVSNRTEGPTPTEVWNRHFGNPLAWVDATYLVLRNGLGRQGSMKSELVVAPVRDGFHLTAPGVAVLGVAYSDGETYIAEAWPAGQGSLVINQKLPPKIILTYDQDRITAVWISPATPEKTGA